MAELFDAKRITKTLEVEGSEPLIHALGIRELVAGAGVTQAGAGLHKLGPVVLDLSKHT